MTNYGIIVGFVGNVIFFTKNRKHPIDNPKIVENIEQIEGVEIKTHIVRYDLKTDFKIKKNQ